MSTPMDEQCYLHKRRSAAIECDLCQRPICDKCVLDEGIRIVCPACVDDAKTRRVAGNMGKWVTIALVMIALVGGIGYWVSQERPLVIQSELDVQKAIKRGPNDPDVWLAVGRYRLRQAQTSADALPAIKDLRRALVLRPEHGPTLLELAYAFHRRGLATETQDALERAKRAGVSGPRYHKLVGVLGDQTHAARRQQEKSDQRRISDKRASDRLKADLAQARQDLTDARERGWVLEEKNAELRDKSKEAETEEADGEGCELDVEVSRSGLLQVEMEFEGTQVKMLVDTGASYTVISREIFDDLELEVIDEPAVKVRTANGVTEMERAEVSEVTLGGITTGRLVVGICDGCIGINGLLGGELLRRYGVTINAAERTVSVRDCDEE